MVQTESDYVAPPSAPHQHLIPSIESDAGRIVLRPNMYGHGYKLTDDAEGFGAGDVENELTPRLGRRGAMLGTQRETESDMFLPIVIRSTSAAEVRRMVAELTKTMQLANGTFRVTLTDPETGQSRYRDVAYREGLKTPVWSSPLAVKFSITADYMDPWAYSTENDSTTIHLVESASGGLQFPITFPINFGGSGGVNSRFATNEGDNPAPVTLHLNGPLRDPVVSVRGGWRFALTGELAWDEYLVIDSRERLIEIRSITGRSPRAGYSWIRNGSKFSDLVIQPGQSTFEFTASDNTYTASLDVFWPHTYQSMQ